MRRPDSRLEDVGGAAQGRLTLFKLQLPELAVAISLLLAALLRFVHLDASSLWNDEGNSWAMLSRSFGEIAAAAAADIHPPGYYWLLKAWSLPVGDSAMAMRGLSAMLGVALVALIAAIGRRATHGEASWRWFPALAAFLAAVNPFQIYYSQEARMYMLLAVEATGLFWAFLWLIEAEDGELKSSDRTTSPGSSPSQSPICSSSLLPCFRRLSPQALFVFFGIAGLWTHYSFPIVLAAAGASFVVRWAMAQRRSILRLSALAALLRFLTLNLLILLAFLPWLPTAIDRVLNWPKGGVAIGAPDGLTLTLRTLLFGPLRTTPEPVGPWLALAGLLPVMGLFALRRRPCLRVIGGLWLLAPVAMMFGLGLFSDAFLKFLLVASPAWCLLTAAAPWTGSPTWALGRLQQTLLILAAVGFSAGAAIATLPLYYNDPFARDNYQGIARYLKAVGDPHGDLVLLNAPGQQEVWRYYDPGLPVLALPAQRPAVPADVETRLEAATREKRRVFALFWATEEADPAQLVEGWLNANAFKTLESWQGNLRFVVYTFANDLVASPFTPVRWENGMVLLKVEQGALPPQRVSPGDAAIVRLTWSAEISLNRRYKVSVQLLDERNQVIAQHDGEPGGGAMPTDRWSPGQRIIDNHGVAIPFGTPPGLYALKAALYDAETGVRVRQSGVEMVSLGSVVVERAVQSPPTDVIPMQHRLGETLGRVQLVGYDAYRRGFAHAPKTPLHPGDTVTFIFYWQAPSSLPADWPLDLTMTLRLGAHEVSAPLAGAYPTGAWTAGELVRSVVETVYDGSDARPRLTVEGVSIALETLPTQ
ncbi:MAG: glycosyltransferase family 39 protein [Caldilinea sp.]|nr:glycosyltransferase family 39 protein [Caldilinea sp.]MDW8441676.1 glycosyltransferase family 39 protein [Caldilineaceae bacterium]